MSRPSRLRLTERDRALLSDLALSTVLRIDAVVSLGYFTGISRARRRMAALESAGYVRRTYVAEGSPFARSVFAIDASAVDVVARYAGLDRDELLRQSRRPLARALIEHSVMVADARIALLRGYSGAKFLAEPLARHEYTEDGRARVFRPDGAILVRGVVDLVAFLECDRGTVGHAKWRESVAGYRRYVRLGIFSGEYRNALPAVLVVTTSERRAARLSSIARATAPPAFWFATARALERGGPLARIWVGQSCETSVSFVDIAREAMRP